jgi:uncharacterized membrane protein
MLSIGVFYSVQRGREAMIQKNYTAFSGQNLGRLAALSDGIFAIVMTLLVLDLRVPVMELVQNPQPLWADGAIQSEQQLLNALSPLLPSVVAYLISFMTLGIFWVGQQTQHNFFARTNRNLVWIHLGFLLAVSLMPFSTALLAEYFTFRLAVLIYWLNIFFLGLMLYVGWRYAERNDLLTEEATAAVRAATYRRIITYQVLYGTATALCIVSTYLSIFLLVVFQVSSIIAPRFSQRTSP